VKFEVSEAPETLRYCHCESCKKLSGGTGTLNGRVRSTSIRIVDGAELLETFEPPGGSAKTFCKRCGSNLFGGGWPNSEMTSVRASALDDEFAARPSGAHLRQIRRCLGNTAGRRSRALRDDVRLEG
jgi:ADP-ribosyl-[dinitrogen reductase] hydrolase